MDLSIVLDIHVHIQVAPSHKAFGIQQRDGGLLHDIEIHRNAHNQAFHHIIPCTRLLVRESQSPLV